MKPWAPVTRTGLVAPAHVVDERAPGRLAALPQLVQQQVVLVGVHAVPEALVPERVQLALGRASRSSGSRSRTSSGPIRSSAAGSITKKPPLTQLSSCGFSVKPSTRPSSAMCATPHGFCGPHHRHRRGPAVRPVEVDAAAAGRCRRRRRRRSGRTCRLSRCSRARATRPPVGVSSPGVDAGHVPRAGLRERRGCGRRRSRAAARSRTKPCAAYRHITCQRIGFPPISTSGLGSVSPASRMRVPFPPQRIATGSIGAGAYRSALQLRQPRTERRVSDAAAPAARGMPVAERDAVAARRALDREARRLDHRAGGPRRSGSTTGRRRRRGTAPPGASARAA